MPLLSQLSDPQLDAPSPNIVQGPRKRRPTQRLRENGDPLACKRARKNTSSAALTVSNPPSVPAVVEGATASNPPAATVSRLPQGLGTADSSDNGAHEGLATQAINIDDSDEDAGEDDESEGGGATELDKDDDAELGKSSCYIFDLID